MTRRTDELTESEPILNGMSEVRIKRYNFAIEISLFIIMLSVFLTGAAVSNLILYRTCVHSLNHPDHECQVFISANNKNVTPELEKEVQQYATFISTVKSILESIMPAVLSLFLGVWSDTHGRKPLMVWPILGLSMSAMLLVVYSMLNNLGPWWYILTIIPYSLSGGFIVLMTGALCYISDISSTENRSIRMAVLGGVISAGMVSGNLLSAYVLKAVGIVYLILIGAALNVFAYAILNIYLKESLVGAVPGNFSTVLNSVHIKEMIHECFKSRPNHGREQILLLTFANSISLFVSYGLMNLEYMYVRQKIHWVLKDYTLYSTVNTVCTFFGSFIGLYILQKLFGMGDVPLVNISFVSALLECAIKALAVSSWHMYLSAIMTILKDLSTPLIRSFITKIVPLEDTAKIFALMAAIEGFCPLLVPLVYNSVYGLSITSFPSAIYVLSCGLLSICIVFVGIVQYFRWKIPVLYQPLNSDESES